MEVSCRLTVLISGKWSAREQGVERKNPGCRENDSDWEKKDFREKDSDWEKKDFREEAATAKDLRKEKRLGEKRVKWNQEQ